MPTKHAFRLVKLVHQSYPVLEFQRLVVASCLAHSFLHPPSITWCWLLIRRLVLFLHWWCLFPATFRCWSHTQTHTHTRTLDIIGVQVSRNTSVTWYRCMNLRCIALRVRNTYVCIVSSARATRCSRSRMHSWSRRDVLTLHSFHLRYTSIQITLDDDTHLKSKQSHLEVSILQLQV